MNEILVSKFFESKIYAWAPSTQKSQKARLNSVLHLIGKDPNEVWSWLESHQAPYTRTVTWGVITEFYDFLISIGEVTSENIYSKWRKANRRQFKHVYERKQPSFTFEEAKEKILSIKDEGIRKKALELLGSGMRWSESFTYENGKVVGKGSKKRTVYKPKISGPEWNGSYSTFWLRLSEVGLKPHDLRKLVATRLHKSGMSVFDLCHHMGWSDPKTAMAYIQPDKEKTMLTNVKKALGM